MKSGVTRSKALLPVILLLLSVSGRPSGGLDLERSLARAYYEEEKYPESVEGWKAVIRGGGGTPRDHLNLGLALLAEMRSAEALSALETSRLITPDEPRIYFALGILEKREGRYPRAIEALERARKLAPRDVPTLFNLGVVYSTVNRTPEIGR